MGSEQLSGVLDIILQQGLKRMGKDIDDETKKMIDAR